MQKLISMFNPVGAIIQAVITIYNMIQFFIERAKQIAALVNAVFNSIAEIAGGNIKKAVTAVEDSLVKALPVAISFMANLAGIGGITAKIKEIIQKIRKPIDKAVGKVVGFIVGKAKALIGKVKDTGKAVGEGVKGKVGEIREWWKNRKGFKTKDGEEHTIFFEGTKTDAKLMIASDPTPVFEFLKTAKSNPENKDIVNKAGQIASKIIAISKQLAKLSNNPQDKEKQIKFIADQDAAISELVVILKGLGIEEKNANGWILLLNNLRRVTQGEATFVYKQRDNEILGAEVYLGQERGFVVGDASKKNKYVSSLNETKFREEYITLSGKDISKRREYISGSGEGKSNTEKIKTYDMVLEIAAKNRIPIITIVDPNNPTDKEVEDYRHVMRECVVETYGENLEALDNQVLHNNVLMGKVDNRILGEIFELWVIKHAGSIEGSEVCFKNKKGEILRKSDGRISGTDILVEMKSVLSGPSKEHIEQMNDYARFLGKTPGLIVSNEGREERIFNKIRYYFSNVEAARKWESILRKIFEGNVEIYVGKTELNSLTNGNKAISV